MHARVLAEDELVRLMHDRPEQRLHHQLEVVRALERARACGTRTRARAHTAPCAQRRTERRVAHWALRIVGVWALILVGVWLCGARRRRQSARARTWG